jgi:HEAT repeat protein
LEDKESVRQDKEDVARRVPSGIAQYRSNRKAWASPKPKEICAWFGRDANDATTAVRVLSELLHDPGPDIRKDAVDLLGYLHDMAARKVLVGTLVDPEKRVRFAACYALGRLSLGEAEHRALVKVCRTDESADVRVAAALVRGRDDEDAVAAFRVGLTGESTYLRDECERSLARMGKLALPLPDKVYELVSREKFEEWLKAGQVERQAIKDGTLYFEVESIGGMPGPPGGCALGPVRHWYKTRAE